VVAPNGDLFVFLKVKAHAFFERNENDLHCTIPVNIGQAALGAEIQGVDLAKPLSNSEFDQIHRTFLEKGILLFRDQKITREQHIAFSRRFGELDRHDSLPRKYCKGMHEYRGMCLSVSRGMGFSSAFQVRVFCPCEVAEIKLSAISSQRSASASMGG